MAKDRNVQIGKKQTYGKLQQVFFDPQRFDQLLENLGVRMMHYRVAPCPNVTSLEYGDHDINCTQCDQSFLPYDEEEFIGILTQQGLENRPAPEGQWIQGRATLTAPSEIRFEYNDRIVMLDSVSINTELLKRNDRSNVDKTRYRMLEIKYIASNSRKFHEGADYKINRDGRIEWVGSNRPEKGEIYTIAYEHHTMFRVIELIHNARDQLDGRKKKDRQPSRLPQQCIIMIDYLVDTDKDRNVND